MATTVFGATPGSDANDTHNTPTPTGLNHYRSQTGLNDHSMKLFPTVTDLATWNGLSANAQAMLANNGGQPILFIIPLGGTAPSTAKIVAFLKSIPAAQKICFCWESEAEGGLTGSAFLAGIHTLAVNHDAALSQVASDPARPNMTAGWYTRTTFPITTSARMDHYLSASDTSFIPPFGDTDYYGTDFYHHNTSESLSVSTDARYQHWLTGVRTKLGASFANAKFAFPEYGVDSLKFTDAQRAATLQSDYDYVQGLGQGLYLWNYWYQIGNNGQGWPFALPSAMAVKWANLQGGGGGGGGSAPVVTVTQPASGASIAAGTDVLAKATVTDADSDLSTVTVKLDAQAAVAATLVSGSYQHDYGTALASGSHTITYTATDAAGHVTTGSTTFTILSAGSPPVVTITQPTAGQSITSGGDVLAKATVTDPDNDLATVTVKLDAQAPVTATLVSGSYQHDYGTALAVGTHTLVYTATDAAGNVTTKNVTFSVVSTGSPPAVTITQPTSGQVFTQGDDVFAKATVTDVDGDLSTVTVKLDAGSFVAASLVGGVYQHDYGTSLVVGSHSVTFKATDVAGNITTTAVSFTVQAPAGNPIVTVQTPVDGSSVNDAGPVVAACTAAGQGGATITGVTSKLDAGSAIAMTLSGGVWSHSYTGPFSDASHTITFVATDNHGAQTTVATTFTAVSSAWNPTYDLRGALSPGTLSRAATMQVRTSWSQTDSGAEAVRVAKECVFISGNLGTGGLAYTAQMVAAHPELLWANYEKNWAYPVSGDTAGTLFPAKWYAKYRGGGKVQQAGTFVNWLMEVGGNAEARASTTVQGVTETAYGAWHLKQILAQYATLHAKFPAMRFAVWYDTAGTFCADDATHFWQQYDATLAPSGDPGWNPHLVKPYGAAPVVGGNYTDKTSLLAMLWWVGDLSRNQAGSPWAAINTGLYMVCANGAVPAGANAKASDIAGHYDMVMTEGWTHQFGTWIAGTTQASAEGQLQTSLDVQLVHGSVHQVLDWAQAGYTAAQFTQFRRVSAVAALIAQRTGAGVVWEFADIKSDNPAVETAKDPSLYKLQLGAPLHEPAVVAANYPLGHRVPVGTAAGQASAVGLLVQQFAGGTVVWNYTSTAKTYHVERGLVRVADLQDTSTPAYASGAAVVINPQSATLFTTSTVTPPTAPSNTAAPVVTPNGSSPVGTILATSDGSWVGTLPMTPDYQWQVSADGSTGWTNIVGATNPQFDTTGHATMYARCGVRETNAAGSSPRVYSAAVGPFTTATTPPGWVGGTGPSISGAAVEGATLTCNPGTITGNPTPSVSFQWDSSLTPTGSYSNIPGATSSTYTLPVGSAGKYISCKVNLVNTAGTAGSNAPYVGPVQTAAAPPHLTQPPVIQLQGGVTAPTVGVNLHAAIDATTIQGSSPFSYAWEWRRYDAAGGGSPTVIGSAQDYQPILADQGHALRVFVTVTNTAGSDTGLSAATAPVTGPATFAPTNTSPPVVSPTGSIPAGTKLTTTNGAWAGTLPMTPDYQWQYSLDGLTGWANIGGATNPFRWTTSDAGRYLRCGVRMTNSVGASLRVYSNVAGPVSSATTAPVFGQPPTISGEAVEGSTLTVDPVQPVGTPPPSTSYQWQSSPDNAAWTNIGGATASTLVLPGGSAGTYRRCMVTLSNGTLPNAVAATNSLGPVTAATTAPHLTVPPTIQLVGGVSAPTVGLSVHGFIDEASITGTLPFTYAWQWQHFDAAGGGTGLVVGSAQDYTPVASDAGHTLRVFVTVTNSAGSDNGESPASAPVVAPVALPVNIAKPVVSPPGSSPVGTILATSDGVWTGALPMTPDYQWGVAPAAGGPFTRITSATSQTFDTTGYTGQYARSSVRMTNSAGSSTRVFSTPVGPFTLTGTAPSFLDTPHIIGEAAVTQALTAIPGRVTGLPTPTLSYQWHRDGADIGGAVNQSYRLILADSGAMITVTISASNGIAPDAAYMTAAVGPVAASSDVPSISGVAVTYPGATPQVGVACTGQVSGLAGTPPFNYVWQWQRCDAAGGNNQSIPGATSQTYTPLPGDEGSTLRVVVVISNSAGTTNALSIASPLVAPPPPPPPPPPPLPPPISKSLGCGVYDVMIHARGGETIRHQLDLWTSVKWSRNPGAPGSGSVDLSGLSADDFARCCSTLSDVIPWADELALYRRRDGELVGTLLWVGPIGDVSLNTGKAVIPAQDLLAWFDVRFVHHDSAWVDTDLVEIAIALMQDGLAPDPSPGITLGRNAAGIRGSMAVAAADYATVGEKLRSLVEQGLRLYCLRRTVTAAGYPEPVLEFADASFGEPPQMTLRGSAQATRIAVTGQQPPAAFDATTTGDAPATPQATCLADESDIATYGLIERADQTDSTTTVSVQDDACRWLGEVEKPVAIVESGVLSRDAAMSVDDLIPGRVCHVRLVEQCYTIDGRYLLALVEAEAAGGSERVTVHFTPLSGGLV